MVHKDFNATQGEVRLSNCEIIQDDIDWLNVSNLDANFLKPYVSLKIGSALTIPFTAAEDIQTSILLIVVVSL